MTGTTDAKGQKAIAGAIKNATVAAYLIAVVVLEGTGIISNDTAWLIGILGLLVLTA